MDLLLACAQKFERLLPYRYKMIIGRKGKALSFSLDFERADFHHLMGLHKLKDILRFQTGKRADIFNEILAGKLTLDLAEHSEFFHEMAPRSQPLSHLENFLDSNELIFRYNPKRHTFSAIQADYLLQNTFNDVPVYLFLSKRNESETYVSKTFFPKNKLDYAKGQMRYTLLYKEKQNIITGDRLVQFNRLK